MRGKSTDVKVTALRGVRGLHSCPDQELAALGRMCDELDVVVGDVLATEGRPAGQAWIVLEGQAEVRRSGSLLWDAGPGDLLGDLGVLGPSPGAATVTAVSPMRLLSLSPRAADVVFDLPGVARWAFAQLDRRLRELTCAPAAYETKPEVVAALTTQAFEVPAPA